MSLFDSLLMFLETTAILFGDLTPDEVLFSFFLENESELFILTNSNDFWKLFFKNSELCCHLRSLYTQKEFKRWFELIRTFYKPYLMISCLGLKDLVSFIHFYIKRCKNIFLHLKKEDSTFPFYKLFREPLLKHYLREIVEKNLINQNSVNKILKQRVWEEFMASMVANNPDDKQEKEKWIIILKAITKTPCNLRSLCVQKLVSTIGLEETFNLFFVEMLDIKMILKNI